MKFFVQNSLFRRYLWVACALTIELFLLIFGYLWFAKPDTDSVNSDLQLAAQGLLTFADPQDPQKTKAAAEKIYRLHLQFSPTKAQAGDVQYAIFRGGQLLASSENPPLGIIAARLAQPLQTTVYEQGWYLAGTAARETDTVAFFAVTERLTRRTLRDALLASLSWVALSALIFMLLASAFAARYAMRPIVDLAEKIKSLKMDAFEKMNPDKAHAELVPIITAINERTNTIKAQMDGERQFFSNAAHELRTPLAVIQAQAHAVECATSDEDREQSVSRLQLGVQRAAHSLVNMLRLARLDALAPLMPKQRLNVQDVVSDCIALHAPRAFAAQQNLSLNATEDVFVEGQPDDLRVVLDNLLDNAIKYAGERAEIVVSVALVEKQSVSITVCDDGPGFSGGDHATAFERFRRGSQSHAHHGSGLGLAISKAAAKNLSGDIFISQRNGRGLFVTVVLPKC